MRKNKIGARKLSQEEITSILPTYNQIHVQINQFRSEKSIGEKTDWEDGRNRDIDQKTNNIGIIGVRGAGKTSILKTLREDLQKHQKENNDIVLPIVVPENMSESSTLMATILGMLSEEVKTKDSEQPKAKYEDCIRKSNLRSCCDNVIKQYTYIQKEYRDILIHEYTTDNQYVSSSEKVFNSDTEFIYKFNQLIEMLMRQSGKEKGLLFVFIDDIDLSTYRCADVVKTLLSYLSNENIVTLISGDLDTFEEALTLDFLRQEQALEKDMLKSEIGNQPILESKKLLAYEYLKKILPPAYRHNIKHWSLEERANYCITGEEAGEGKRLSALLEEALRGWVDPAFFHYMEGGARMSLPYTYCLFDSTSRGLNNVYNVLNDIVRKRQQLDESKEKGNSGEQQKKRREQQKSELKKILLDTIVSSKATYNRYREQIQKRMLMIGSDRDSSNVFFDNACSIIYKAKPSNPDPKGTNAKTTGVAQGQKASNEYEIGDAAERFALYVLVDFAARLLYEEEYGKLTKENEYYIRLKAKAMEDFFFHPEIAEKTLDVSSKGWEDKEGFNLNTIDFKKLSLERLNKCFLLKGDLTLNLAYYKNLPLENVLELYQDSDDAKQKGAAKKETASLRQSIIIALWKAIASAAALNPRKEHGQMSASRQTNDERSESRADAPQLAAGNFIGRNLADKVAELYPIYTMEFLYIREQLSDSMTQNEVLQLFDELWDEAYKNERTSDGNTGTWEEQQRELQAKRILLNTIAQRLKKEGEDTVKEEWEELSGGDILDINGKPIPQETLKKRGAFLKAIDRGALWGEATAEPAAAYLKSEIVRYITKIYRCLYCVNHIGDVESVAERIEQNWIQRHEGEWRLDTGAVIESWKKFYKSEDGVSYTKSKEAKDGVRRNLAGHSFEDKMPYEIYDRILRKLRSLATNDRVWYGRAEAQKVCDALRLCYAVPLDMQNPKNSWYHESYFTFLLQCYYKYKRFLGNAEGMSKDASLLTQIAVTLSEAYLKSDMQIMNTFIDRLNSELAKEKADEKTTIEEFEEIFAKTKEGNRP